MNDQVKIDWPEGLKFSVTRMMHNCLPSPDGTPTPISTKWKCESTWDEDQYLQFVDFSLKAWRKAIRYDGKFFMVSPIFRTGISFGKFVVKFSMVEIDSLEEFMEPFGERADNGKS